MSLPEARSLYEQETGRKFMDLYELKVPVWDYILWLEKTLAISWAENKQLKNLLNEEIEDRR